MLNKIYTNYYRPIRMVNKIHNGLQSIETDILIKSILFVAEIRSYFAVVFDNTV